MFGDFEVSPFLRTLPQVSWVLNQPQFCLLSLGGWHAGLPGVHVFEVAYLWKLPPTFEIQGIALTAESSPNNSIYNFPGQVRLAVLHEWGGQEPPPPTHCCHREHNAGLSTVVTSVPCLSWGSTWGEVEAQVGPVQKFWEASREGRISLILGVLTDSLSGSQFINVNKNQENIFK